MKGNVGFASAAAGWSFTLQSYARLYVDVYGSAFDAREFARRLWGDVWFHPDTRTFRRKAPQGVPDVQRSFVQFVLEPLYKIYSQVWEAVGETRLAMTCITSFQWGGVSVQEPLCPTQQSNMVPLSNVHLGLLHFN